MRIILSVFALFLMAVPAVAQDVPASRIAAIDAADDDDFATAFETAGDDALSRDIISWIYLRSGEADFADYESFLETHADWPGLERIRARGEEAMAPDMAPADVISWFGEISPVTGEGAVRLAEALIVLGQEDRANAVLQIAWEELSLTETGHQAMVDGFGDLLADYHAARVDALLWRWRTDEARWMLPLLSEDQQALVAARIGYIRKGSGLDALSEAVPESLAGHPGLAYDRYNWLANQGRRLDAIEILSERSVSVAALGEPFRWSGWRRSLARWEMREGRIESAYDLASQHFLTEGSSYADLEWLAGYLALRYLDDPSKALTHFDNFANAVDSPISLGRAGYWRARAHLALGDANAAATAYADGAKHQTGFYGLLSAEALGMELDPALSGAGDATDWEGADVMNTDLTRVALAFLAAGDRSWAVNFFAELGRTLPADDISRLSAWLQSKDEAYFAVLLGKAAARRGEIIPSAYFPLHPLKDMDLPVPAELSLAIARRESEFNAGAGSPVGALGLMQLMPATAQEVSGFLSLPYAKSKLTSDWQYNALLGSKYLSVLEEQFGYSPVQMTAGYNAGPSRPEGWMDTFGDPRIDDIDVIDWIEHIPFRETRNYVMRVTEAMPIYQARLGADTGPIRFRSLLIGGKPLIRPVARGDRRAAAAEETTFVAPSASTSTSTAPAVAAPTAIPRPSGAQGIRPISRPGG